MRRERCLHRATQRRLGFAMAACALFWCGSALAQSTAVIPGATVAPDRTPRELNRFERYGTAQAETDDESDAPSADVNFRRPFDSFSFGTGIAGSDAAGAGRRFVPQNARSTSRGRPNRAARRASPAREQPPLGRVTDSGPIGRRPQDRAIGANASTQPAGPPAGYAPIYTVPRPRRAGCGDPGEGRSRPGRGGAGRGGRDPARGHRAPGAVVRPRVSGPVRRLAARPVPLRAPRRLPTPSRATARSRRSSPPATPSRSCRARAG